MNVFQTLFCFFFLTLRDGNASSELYRTETEGGNITVACSFKVPGGKRKMFCKNNCEHGDILAETTGDRNQSGRYSLKFEDKSKYLPSYILYVTITNLTKIDSGRYECKLGREWFPDSSETFEIIVKDATTTPKPFTTSLPLSSKVTTTPSPSRVTTTQIFSSSAASPVTNKSQKQTPGSETTAGPLLSLGLVLLLMIIILSATLLIFCRKKARKQKGAPVETFYTEVHQANPVYEEISEKQRESRPPAGNFSTVYTYAKFDKPSGAETSDNYSTVAASFQNSTEDDPDKLAYSVVDFSSCPGSSVRSPQAVKDKTVYSEACAHTSSVDPSDALYSTVTLH